MYQTLNPAAKEIRLVRIHLEADETLPIHLTIKCVSLADQPVYETLSYTWGAPHPTSEIEVHHTDATTTKFSVRQNLHDFLVQFRKEQNEAWLWIDQICINQEDLEEKSHQVIQMAQVYSQAVQVNIWLSSGFQGGDELMDFISTHDHLPFQIKGSVFLDSDKEFDEKNTWVKEFVGKARKHYRKYIQPCRQFIDLPYWSRVWIIQEIALSSIHVVRLGTKIVSWKALALFLHIIAKVSEVLYLPFPRHSAARICAFNYVGNVGRPKMWEDKDFLGHTMRSSGTAECYDKRDCIYGILGLLPEQFRIVPDYSHDLTLQDIMFALLRKYVEVDICSLQKNMPPIQTLSKHDVAALVKLNVACALGSMLTLVNMMVMSYSLDQSSYPSSTPFHAGRDICKTSPTERHVQHTTESP